jgi:hypothetical protein
MNKTPLNALLVLLEVEGERLPGVLVGWDVRGHLA